MLHKQANDESWCATRGIEKETIYIPPLKIQSYVLRLSFLVYCTYCHTAMSYMLSMYTSSSITPFVVLALLFTILPYNVTHDEFPHANVLIERRPYTCPLGIVPQEGDSGTPLFRTPWDQTVLSIEVSSFQGLKLYCGLL